MRGIQAQEKPHGSFEDGADGFCFMNVESEVECL